MYFYNLMKEITEGKKADIYVDMDGVIASYEFGKPLDFKNKRPLKTNIETFNKIAELDNITLHILSVCRKDFQIKDKNDWLDKYAPVFKKENRNILSKETYVGFSSSELKSDFLKNMKSNNLIILIDDDNRVLEIVSRNNSNIIIYQDSELID